MDKLRITFDSNVWRKVASPYCFPKDTVASIYLKLNQLCQERQIIPCLSESIFNIESIKRQDRKEIIGNDRGKIERKPIEFLGGIVKSGITIGPNPDAHPGSSDYLLKHLNDARTLNFRLLYCPRLGAIKNRDISKADYLFFSQNISEKFSEVVTEIESWGCGQAQIRKIGEQYSRFWIDGLQLAPESERKNIAKALAEWADADSVAAHIAYQNNIFCTSVHDKK